MPNKIINPIIKGFNSDPSIIRVGDDYYIANSTFEWFPGVQIHHSRDLKNWKLVARPLNRVSQLDMKGNPDSCGVWAPCLSYHDGTFYLVYSNVRTFDGVWKDTPNYLVTTNDIMGEWSDPIPLAASGFDASLYHGDDGKKWYSTLLVDHRKGKFFGGIDLQEYSEKEQKLVGPVHHIFDGTELGITEGPHIYKLNGYYYLLTAEGGTEYGHAVTIARSKDLTGPYEVHPQNPVVTARNNPKLELQKTGHADIVQTPQGDWYMVFLTGRPLTELGRCTLGRETAIQKIEWKDDWPYLAHGGNEPVVTIDGPDIPEMPFEKPAIRDNFDSTELDINFQSLRIPVTDDWLSLSEKPGYLKLYGRESLSSFHHQSLIARRVQSHNIQASTCLEFEPDTFQQLAGLVLFYNTYHYHYLYISTDDWGKTRHINIITCDKYNTTEPLSEPENIGDAKRVFLKAEFNRDTIQFFYSLEEEKDWKKIGPELDGSILSDDYVRDEKNRYRPAFTGAFVGMCCQDFSGRNKSADFDWFEYNEIT